MVTSMNYTRQCYFYVIIGVVLFDWGNYFPYFLKSIYIVLDIICSTMNNYQIRFFTNSGSVYEQWLGSWTGTISIGSSGNEVSKELSSESVWELPKDCEGELRSVRWLSGGSSNESSEDGDNRLTTVSIEVSFGNCTTISPRCIDQCFLTILGWKSGKSEHTKDFTRRWCGGCLPEARIYCLWGSSRWASNWCIRVTYYSWRGQFLSVCKFSFLVLTNCGRRNNKVTNKQTLLNSLI